MMGRGRNQTYDQVRRSIRLPDSYLKNLLVDLIMDNRYLRMKLKVIEKEVGTIGKHLDDMPLEKKVSWNKIERRTFTWAPDLVSETNCTEVTE